MIMSRPSIVRLGTTDGAVDGVSASSCDKSVSPPSEMSDLLYNALRAGDKAFLLPAAHQSSESTSLKNVVIAMSVSNTEGAPRVFSDSWGHGISAVPVASEAVAQFFSLSASERASRIQALADSLPNAPCDDDLVGTVLQREEAGHDAEEWQAGLDSVSSCLGLYARERARNASNVPSLGTARPHTEYFLVCKAGAGRAAEDLDTIVQNGVEHGRSPSSIFGEDSGFDEQMRWVAAAGRRNRGRLLYSLACALGCDQGPWAVDTMLDSSTHPDFPAARLVVTNTDVCSTSLRRGVNDAGEDVFVFFANAIDTSTARSGNIISCNSPGLGFVVLERRADDAGETSGLMPPINNPACNALPFGTLRVANRTNVIVRGTTDPQMTMTAPHPDEEWMRSHFFWKRSAHRVRSERISQKTAEAASDVLPVQLWGTHAPETWTRDSASCLGTNAFAVASLWPVACVVSGTEPTKLNVLATQMPR